MTEIHFWQGVACGLALAVALQAIMLAKVIA
jgi:hypothetical protein